MTRLATRPMHLRSESTRSLNFLRIFDLKIEWHDCIPADVEMTVIIIVLDRSSRSIPYIYTYSSSIPQTQFSQDTYLLHLNMSTTQCTRLLTRNIPQVRRRRQLQNPHVTLVGSPSNPTIDSERLPYRLYELSLKKIRKEAHAAEPDLRHVIAGISMQKSVSTAVHDDLLHQVDILESRRPRLPLLPGADEAWEHEEVVSESPRSPWDMEALDQALYEMERASKKGEVARTVCFQLISEM
ncbi:unnamed protein product [Penicillium salamii]|uniref:Uncharacterized protein n=1 Tax=Penicillium salamii TaxID=1612424 RepID=A0A9W4IIC3_9EURO|nr:unnamed protein product [Penicillium salamii]CAG8230048.1 unnamed protein product [Penicillium salamii]CAG8312486.1 unnamed protein product [Penicillium salamii]CAG8389111.1 unnamed protein product [Penicillium salamii]CAG8392324.1 unnamed protein product [Penicillium salamii]